MNKLNLKGKGEEVNKERHSAQTIWKKTTARTMIRLLYKTPEVKIVIKIQSCN